MLDNKKIDQVNSSTYLECVICKDDAEAQGIFWKKRKISLWTNVRIAEATVMTDVKYGSEAWELQQVAPWLDHMTVSSLGTCMIKSLPLKLYIHRRIIEPIFSLVSFSLEWDKTKRNGRIDGKYIIWVLYLHIRRMGLRVKYNSSFFL